MKFEAVLSGLSVVTASLILLIGVALLGGFVMPDRVPANYRYTLGGIMTAYALYRIGMALYRFRQRRINEASDDEPS